MLRWLVRLLVLAVIAVVGVMVVSRLTNREEDFDEYDDLDAGLDFQETPVEIEVPAEQFAASGSVTSAAPTPVSSEGGGNSASSPGGSNGTGGNGMGSNSSLETTRLEGGESLTDVVGIGPAFDARLKAIGINTLADLAQADANSINEQVDVIGGVATVEDWIAQAKSLTSGGQSQ